MVQQAPPNIRERAEGSSPHRGNITPWVVPAGQVDHSTKFSQSLLSKEMATSVPTLAAYRPLPGSSSLQLQALNLQYLTRNNRIVHNFSDCFPGCSTRLFANIPTVALSWYFSVRTLSTLFSYQSLTFLLDIHATNMCVPPCSKLIFAALFTLVLLLAF